MKNLKELQDLLSESARIDEYLQRVKTIGFLTDCGRKISVGIKDNYNRRYNFDGIEAIIGSGKLREILEQFETRLTEELATAKKENEQALAKFSIEKS